jgi:tetratricopeptide (TPR) repeat protein
VEDLDTAVRIASALVRLEKTGEAFKVLAPFRTEGQEVPVAPLNREAAFTLFIARNLLRGHFERARALAAGRSLLQPDNALWARVHAHLVEGQGGDSLGILSQSIGRSTSKATRMELLAETLRLQVQKEDLEGAGATLKTLRNYGRKTPWFRYGLGMMHEARGKQKAAKRSYQRAFKARNPASAAHLAHGRLTKKGLPLGVLGDLATNRGVSEATLPYARALLADGRWESAVRVLEEALWQGAITDNPMEVVLTLSAACLAGNQAPRAVELLVLIQEGAPEDQRPIDRLLEIAPAHPDLVDRSVWEARREKLEVFNEPPSEDAPGDEAQKEEEEAPPEQGE